MWDKQWMKNEALHIQDLGKLYIFHAWHMSWKCLESKIDDEIEARNFMKK